MEHPIPPSPSTQAHAARACPPLHRLFHSLDEARHLRPTCGNVGYRQQIGADVHHRQARRVTLGRAWLLILLHGLCSPTRTRPTRRRHCGPVAMCAPPNPWPKHKASAARLTALPHPGPIAPVRVPPKTITPSAMTARIYPPAAWLGVPGSSCCKRLVPPSLPGRRLRSPSAANDRCGGAF